MAGHASPQKIPRVFFRAAGGSEPVREWLKELDEAERQASRERPPAGAMALAGGYADVPSDGWRTLGNPDRSSHTKDGAGADLLLPGAPGRAARLHQEDTGDAD